MDFGRCESQTCDPRIVVSERQSKLTLDNPDRKSVRRVRVDGCLPSDGPRCDYLLIPAAGFEIFVELKGSDIAHAVLQLEASILAFGVKTGLVRRESFIVSTRSPKHSPEIQRLQSRFRKSLSSGLTIRERQHVVPI